MMLLYHNRIVMSSLKPTKIKENQKKQGSHVSPNGQTPSIATNTTNKMKAGQLAGTVRPLVK